MLHFGRGVGTAPSISFGGYSAMENFMWGCVAVVMIAGGSFMTLWPATSAAMNRDDAQDASPPSAGEVWQMRIAGTIFAVAGAYALYLILTGAPVGDPGDTTLF